MKHIFIVDDEQNIRDLLTKYLEKEGYKVTAFSGGKNVAAELVRLKPDLLVLDIMMPEPDGLELCKEIRKKSEIPLIFVSARDEEYDRILGLELGADDYLTKPFSPRELVARIKNVFRRLDRATSPHDEEISLKDMKIFCRRRYIEKDGLEIRLTTKEYDLFEFLARNKNMPFTREQLMEKVWGYDALWDIRVVDDLIKRLRKKLGEAGSRLEITTVWGFGYRIDG